MGEMGRELRSKGEKSCAWLLGYAVEDEGAAVAEGSQESRVEA